MSSSPPEIYTGGAYDGGLLPLEGTEISSSKLIKEEEFYC